MPQATGANTKIIYDVEATFGTTPVAPASVVLPFVSESLIQKRDFYRTNIIRGSRSNTMPKQANKDVGGSVVTELNPFQAKLLKHLLGVNVITGGAPPYIHTMKVGALPVSMCIEKQFLDLATPQYFLYNGVRVNKANFKFNASGIVPVTFDFLGKKETISTSSFHASPVDYGHVPWDMSEMAILEGGGSIANVTDVDLSVENGLDGGLYVIGGGGERRALTEGMTNVTGKLICMFEDVTTLNKAINSTESSLSLTLSRGDGTGTAGNEYCQFLISELKYKQASPAINGPAGLVVSLDFEGYYDNGGGATSIQIIVKNTQATL
jgi:hypothetical protein